MDVLAGGDGAPHQRRPPAAGRALHENLVRAGERGVEIGGPAQPAVGGSERRQPGGIAAHQQRVGNQPVAVAQQQAAVGADRHQVAQVLGSAYAPGGAVDDDADLPLRHDRSLRLPAGSVPELGTVASPVAPAAAEANIRPLSPTPCVSHLSRKPPMQNQEWEIPPNLQPDPDEYEFDLERAMRAVVGLRSNVPADAFTAGTLGTERAGNGVVIREDGLVLTIGYLITEAETVWIVTADGRAVPGHALAYDQTTGFGLVQALGRLNLPSIELGDSNALPVGSEVIMAAGGGRHHAIETKVVGRQEFAGYWEYLIDNAIFTSPAHPFWSGSALIGRDGRLLGTGSLILQQGDGKRRMDMNMVVPVALLR